MSKWIAKGFTIYEQETGLKVASINNKGHLKETAERNTRLIANAPEMYEFLRVFTTDKEVSEDTFDDYILLIHNARKLVARIDGEQEVKE